MTDSLKLTEMQRTSIEFERQRHLANWFIKSSPHMATPPSPQQTTTTAAATTTTTATAAATAATSTTAAATTSPTALSGNGNSANNSAVNNSSGSNSNTPTAASASNNAHQHGGSRHHSGGHSHNLAHHSNPNAPVFFLMSSNGQTAATHHQQQQQQHQQQQQQHNGKHHNGSAAAGTAQAAAAAAAMGGAGAGVGGGGAALSHLGHVEGRKPKLRRFNSHDTSSNMFSVADFENARLARRNEIELKQRLQRRMRMSANAGGCGASGSAVGSTGVGCVASYGSGGLHSGCGSMGGDYSTGDSKASKYSNESQHEPLPADIFLDRYSLPRVVRISYKTKFCDETLQSSSSNGSSTVTSHSSASGGGGTASGGAAGVAAMGTSHSTGTTTGTGTSSSTASSSGQLNGSSGTNNNNSNSGNFGGCKHAATSHQQQQQQPTHQQALVNSPPSACSAHSAAGTNTGAAIGSLEHQQDHGELFLLYRLVRQRHIYHGHNAKTAAASRKKGVLIPQEFPGYFSLLSDKGLPTATLYTTLLQLVRERVYKFVSVDNMPAFTESQSNGSSAPAAEGCLPIYSPPAANNRPQYVKTTARGGQVFRLLAVFEDGKQDHGNGVGSSANGGGMASKPSANHGREKEKGRYAQLLNENRQVLYVSLSTKGKFYEIEPGIPQILQKLAGGCGTGGGSSGGGEGNKKVNPDCVHRITALLTPQRELPLTLRYISGPSGCASAIPENLCITKISTENVIIACPIEDVDVQSPLHLRKLHLTKEMNLLKSSLGFESDQRMLANPNVQNILKFCQFNCDQFLKMVEVEILSRPERSGSKSRVDGLKILKPLHLPKLLRREKTSISAHEKEDSIIFLTKSDLANLEAKEHAGGHALEAASSSNRISDKMKVFQSTKKKWFRKQDKHAISSLSSLDLDEQAKRLSMERYSDMSKLLQERFGDKQTHNGSQEHESISEPSGASDIGCSDTETTTLATIEEKFGQRKSADTVLQKSMSLQDIELIGGNGARKPDLLLAAADTISEAGTDLEDLENRAPLQQSFITEKLYNEFHVKTRQYSKSSSSLHQLLNFSLPQKLHVHDQKRSLAQLKHGNRAERRLDFNIGEPVTGRRAAGGLNLLAAGNSSSVHSGNSQNTSLISPLTPTSLIEDDLPYSSVRDSLVLSSDEDHPTGAGGGGNICQALHLIDYTKENIYAEICHEASAMGGIPSSQTRDTYSGETHSTHVSDDYGDYASLSYNNCHAAYSGGAHNGGASVATGGLAISRVHINCSSSPVSYHTVYLGDEPLGEHYAEQRRRQRERERERARGQSRDSSHSYSTSQSRDRAHITTVELEGSMPMTTSATNTQAQLAAPAGAGTAVRAGAALAVREEGVDNIYNTLK